MPKINDQINGGNSDITYPVASNLEYFAETKLAISMNKPDRIQINPSDLELNWCGSHANARSNVADGFIITLEIPIAI